MFRSPNFRKIFLVRFIGYFFMCTGFIVLTLVVEPVISEEFKYRSDQLLGRTHRLPKVITSAGENTGGTQSVSPAITSSQVTGNQGQGFGSLLSSSSEIITPVSTDFGIVVEKINANAKVIANVNPSSEQEYIEALSKGVAHAKGTVFPGQTGNIYLFSHSVDAPWNIIRYNAIFYLLNKLDKGDRIIMFYKGRRYDYIVFDKAISSPSDTHFLTDTYNQSVLTLQTCDPPGTLLNRLIVRAQLAGG